MRYILLRSIETGQRFFTTNVFKDEFEACTTADGAVSYEVIGYADTIADAQTKLYGRSFTDSKD